MKKIYILTLLVALAACSPRVDDIFDNTAVVRLDQNAAEVKERLIAAENGWIMQYFAQADPTSSDVTKHRGYTFLFRFRDDGTVTVGAPVNGMFKTETSMWDIINDNSTVLTFNTFNSIFHYYSNPDPDLGLWGADGEGVGGDYEFMVLEYNKEENYQLLKGKKRSCYIRLYPLAANEDWEAYFDKIDETEKRLFTDNVPWELYAGNKHLTLYNAAKHEVRAFEFGADTLGGGAYYGLITTDKGIRFHDSKILDVEINRAAFNFSSDGKRLVSVVDPTVYVTVEGSTVFTSDANNAKPWNVDMNSLPAIIVAKSNTVNTNISNLVPNSRIKSFAFYGAGKDRISLRVYYIVSGDAGNSYDTYYYNAIQEDNYITLTADGTYSSGSILHQYGAMDLVEAFNGKYTIELAYGFTPSKGIELTKSEDFILTMKH